LRFDQLMVLVALFGVAALCGFYVGQADGLRRQPRLVSVECPPCECICRPFVESDAP